MLDFFHSYAKKSLLPLIFFFLHFSVSSHMYRFNPCSKEKKNKAKHFQKGFQLCLYKNNINKK